YSCRCPHQRYLWKVFQMRYLNQALLTGQSAKCCQDSQEPPYVSPKSQWSKQYLHPHGLQLYLPLRRRQVCRYLHVRSEERRVGKECGAGWWPTQCKEKKRTEGGR